MNQFLYENPSEAAVDLFSKRKEDFEVYHQGFSNQIKKWPFKPLPLTFKYIQKNKEALSNKYPTLLP